jgi:hypothetical protein
MASSPAAARSMGFSLLLLALAVALTGCRAAAEDPPPPAEAPPAPALEEVRLSADRSHFVLAKSGARFAPWGFNYDHDRDGRLLEDYWETEWATVVEDFREMKALGANAVRIHLQTGKFMKAPDRPDEAALSRLRNLVGVALECGLRLDLTGLGCYHKKDVPAWYDALDEARRWEVQAAFWEAVAGTCAGHPAVFCYDLMNEPILPGDKKETDWLAGAFAGKHFVQRIARDLAGRPREQVARAWVDRLVAAIRKRDARTPITVGEIPWVFVFGGGKPFFASKEVGERLDFASVHFYPKKGAVEKALNALAAYDLGKPLIVEEMFPLECTLDELKAFVARSGERADGWFGFYWGKTIEEYAREKDIPSAVMKLWLEYFRERAQGQGKG